MRRARVATVAGVLVTAAGAALPVLAARPAAAAECVRVVVDYGTLAGAPAGPNMHCTSSTGNAGQVLIKRAQEVGQQPPRFTGNFLCAIDGYPESGCGDHGDEPYWSFWYWVDGRWVYSSLGVDSYTVRDSDGDGHPDPLGFRYHAFSEKRAPRANPSYPAPTKAATAAPPRTAPPAGGGGASTAPGGAVPTGSTATARPLATGTATAGTGTGTATPAATARTATPTAAPAASGGTAAPAEPTLAEPPPAAGGRGGGVPVATLLALAAAGVLGGVAAVRLRKSA